MTIDIECSSRHNAENHKNELSILGVININAQVAWSSNQHLREPAQEIVARSGVCRPPATWDCQAAVFSMISLMPKSRKIAEDRGSCQNR